MIMAIFFQPVWIGMTIAIGKENILTTVIALSDVVWCGVV
jgi:hypothetical protein